MSKTSSIAGGESPAEGSSRSSSSGPVDERPRQRDQLALAARERAGTLARPLGEQREELERARERGAAFVAREDEHADLQVLRDRQRREDVVGLRHEVEAAPGEPVGPQAGDVLAAKRDAAGADRDQAVDRLEQRRLPGAVRADDADDLAGAPP